MKITRYQLSDEWETYIDNDVTDSKFENEEFVKLSDVEQLQKELNTMLDEWHVRNDITKHCINTIRMRIKDVFNNFMRK